MSDHVFYVYLISRLDGTPCYVGKGKGDRWSRHEKTKRHSNIHLERISRDAQSKGLQLPRIKIAEGLTEEDALRLEQIIIAKIGREAAGGPLVNLTDGGEVGPSGFKWTPELNTRNSRFRGKKHSQESRDLTSLKLKGRPKTEAHNAAVAAALLGSKRSTGWWSTEEGRAKQRQNNRGHTGHMHSAEAINKIKFARMRQDARMKVKVIPTWAERNSVCYHQATA